MTSKLVVNTIEADTGISSVSFASSISMNSTAKFHFSAAGIDIGADTNINRPSAGVLGFNVNGAEKVRIDTNGHMHGVGVVTATHFYGDGSNLTGISGVTINSNADNRIITGSGTAATLNGEANLSFNGTNVKIGSGTPAIAVGSGLEIDSGGAATVRLEDSGSTSSFEIQNTGGVIKQRMYNSQPWVIEHGSGEKLRITSAGKIGIGDNAPSSDLSIKSSAPGILLTDTSGTSQYANIDFDATTLILTARNNTSTAPISFRGYDGTNIKTYMNLTTTGNVVTYNNHLSGSSGHQNTSWYGDDANHYTLEHKDFNEIRAVKTLDSDTYSSIVYKREMMTEYCDIEFTLKGNAPSGTNRHTMFVINGDGSDTFSNYDRLVFRYRPGDTNGNQIRIDKGGGGYGFTEENSSVPNFFDGNERHVHIQIRKRTFSITVNRMGQSEYNLSKRTNADLVSSRGYFGFSLYERASHGTPELTIRDFKITNYTQNAIPSTSVAFQATHSGNPSKSSGYQVKPCNVENFDNGYGGNYNTSNYRFTAPVAGVYQFGNTFNVYSNPSSMFCAIRVNGSTMYTGGKRNSSTGSGDQNVVAHCIVQLEEGDYVEALDHTGNGVTYSSSATWNRFEGSLIAAYK